MLGDKGGVPAAGELLCWRADLGDCCFDLGDDCVPLGGKLVVGRVLSLH